MEIPQIDINLTSTTVEAKSLKLDLRRKNFVKRVPRKFKKKLKKTGGKNGFIDWLNKPVKYVIEPPKTIYYSEGLFKNFILKLEKSELGVEMSESSLNELIKKY